MTPHCTFKV